MTEPLLLRPAEAAERLGISRAQVYRLMRTGALPTVAIGKARRVPAYALVEFVRQAVPRHEHVPVIRPVALPHNRVQVQKVCQECGVVLGDGRTNAGV